MAGALNASHLTTAQSDLSVDEAVKKFEKVVASRNITVFDVIEHSKLADKVGLKMADTTVVIVGSPKVGTLLMQCEPKIALEMPLKFLFYKDGDKTVIAYEDVKDIATRYGAQECEAVSKLSAAQANLLNDMTK
jgi:periplasmic protein